MSEEIKPKIKHKRNRYRLVIMNDDTYEEVTTFRLSRLSVYVVLSSVFVIMVAFIGALLVFTPLKYYIPGYGTRQSRSELQLLKIRTDSLENAVKQKEKYLMDVKSVLAGEETLRDTTAIQVEEHEETQD